VSCRFCEACEVLRYAGVDVARTLCARTAVLYVMRCGAILVASGATAEEVCIRSTVTSHRQTTVAVRSLQRVQRLDQAHHKGRRCSSQAEKPQHCTPLFVLCHQSAGCGRGEGLECGICKPLPRCLHGCQTEDESRS